MHSWHSLGFREANNGSKIIIPVCLLVFLVNDYMGMVRLIPAPSHPLSPSPSPTSLFTSLPDPGVRVSDVHRST